MGIEEEIKQPKFKSPHQKMLINLLYTTSWLNAKQNQLLKPHGISLQQYNILRILRGQYPGSIGVNALMDRMLDRNSNASRLVEKLRGKGLVERTTCMEDRRRVDVKITKKGLKSLDRLEPMIEGFHQALREIDDKEANQVNKVLDQIRELI